MMKKLLFLFALAFFTFSCSDDDGDNVATTANVSYSQTTLNADFYTAGNSSVPTISWNGNQGSFSLDTNTEGLSVNSTTGQVNWTKLLPPGTHNFSVIVSNSAGQVSIPMTIENPLEGQFSGDYDGSSYFAVEFSEDGTMTVYANSESNPDVGPGTWEMNENEITGNYKYEEAQDEYSFKLTVSQTSSSATMDGTWYFDYDAEDGNYGGTLSLEY